MSSPAYNKFMGEAIKLINWAFGNYPDMMTIIPPTIVNAKREKVVKKTADGKVHVRPATITIEVPDKIVAQMKNDPDWKDIIYICHVRGELMERYASKLVLPGEVQN